MLHQDQEYSEVPWLGGAGLNDIIYNVDGGEDERGCELSVMPCNTGPIATNVDLTKSQVLLIDIKTVELNGAVMLDGQPLPMTAQVGATSASPPAMTHCFAPRFCPKSEMARAVAIVLKDCQGFTI